MSTARWHTREDSGLVLDEAQRWWHDGERVEHPLIVEAFNRGLQVTDDGRYQLHFGGDWCFVTVRGCAYQVVVVDLLEDGRWAVRLSDRTAELLDVASLAEDAEGVLTVAVKGGRARARFSRNAQFLLADHPASPLLAWGAG